jgi:hypothetical protein
MFKNQYDKKISKMLKLGKNNIKYLSSSGQPTAGCQGLLGKMGNLEV